MVGLEKNQRLTRLKCFTVNNFQPILRILQMTTLCVFSMLSVVGAVESVVGATVSEPKPLLEPAAVVPLEELESYVSKAPEMLVAVAEMEETLYRLEREQAISGLKINGSAGAGHFREAVTDNRIRDYDRARLSLGLHYPLLGTLARERINVLKAEGRTWESRQRIEITRLKSIEALRSQYVLLWGSHQKLKLCNAFLTDENRVDKILQERKEAGLLLEADRQEFLTAFSLVHRDVANISAVERRAQRNISLLTNGYADTIIAETPSLPFPCLDENILRSDVLAHHPEIIMLQGLVEEQLGVIDLAKHSDIQANVSMTGHGDMDFPSEQEGYGLRVQFNMDLPWQFSKAHLAEESAEQALLRKLQYKLDMVSSRLLVDAEDYLQRYFAALENRRFAAHRVKTALEAVRERALRKAHLPGDMFEQLQSSRFSYYKTAMAYVDAQIIELQARVRLLTFHKKEEQEKETVVQFDSVINENFLKPLWLQENTRQDGEIPVLRCTHKTKHKVKRAGYGVYAWNSRKLLGQAVSGETFWNRLAEMKINTILLSFDGKQLNELGLPTRKSDLQGFMQQAKNRGVSVGLLLGEPTWILPEHRGNILQIISKVQGFGFDVIHLDLEPNQLENTKHPIEYLLAHLLRTVQAVSRITPLPVEVDLHPRYLDAVANNFCLGCGLENLNCVSVTLMVYVKNPRRVAEIIQPIMEKFPKLTFSVAQSVEPLLSREESYAGVSKQHLYNALIELDNLTDNTLQSIYIQSWQDFTDMRDED